MAIAKQEFYEGAALHRLTRGGSITSLRYESPFFIVNEGLLVHLKYSTKKKSPWGFSFTRDERVILGSRSAGMRTVIGLICGSDGVVAVEWEDLIGIVHDAAGSIHISCYRDHGKHYEVCGPSGSLSHKIAPSTWQQILQRTVLK